MDAWVWVVIGVVVVVVVLVAAAALLSRRRRAHLKDRFGPEYDRTLDTAESRRRAERELKEREARFDELTLQPLAPAARERYTQRWTSLQSRFVDQPQIAVADADSLITEIMRDRGYPVDDFDSKSELVSVGHANVVEQYRKGHMIYRKTVEGTASTEDLRQAVVAYRALFEELVSDDDREVDVRRDDPRDDEMPRDTRPLDDVQRDDARQR